jgi:hypothetical protein
MIRLDLLVFGFFLFGAIMLLKYLKRKRMKLKA